MNCVPRWRVCNWPSRQSPDKALQSLHASVMRPTGWTKWWASCWPCPSWKAARTADQYFFVSEITGTVVDDARFEAQEKGVTIDTERRWGSEALVVGSGKLISRAIENIVRNALRFSHRGDTITVELDSTAAGTTLYPGPRARRWRRTEQLASLFEPFVQASTRRTARAMAWSWPLPKGRLSPMAAPSRRSMARQRLIITGLAAGRAGLLEAWRGNKIGLGPLGFARCGVSKAAAVRIRANVNVPKRRVTVLVSPAVIKSLAGAFQGLPGNAP